MSHMAREAAELPVAVARFLDRNSKVIRDLGRRLRELSPPVVLTSARGSSDNAAGYFKYLTEILTGTPCCSIGASVVSVYGAQLHARGAVCITISQSGKSPDIVALQEAARKAGALTVALVNVEDLPAARSADICLGLNAGEELSVAATKSFIVSLAAGAAIVAHWLDDIQMIAAVGDLPETLSRASRIDWPEVLDLAKGAELLYVLGRGPSQPIAAETALKLKETCAIHAEAYSIAEVMHGPLELLGDGFPVLVYSPGDQSRPSTVEAIAKMRRTGANVVVIEGEGVSFESTRHALLDPVSIIQTAYPCIERVARSLGRDPDRPRLLRKVTETI